jgi:purine-nucleoside phosphorylase
MAAGSASSAGSPVHERVRAAAREILRHGAARPDAGLILGSGLGALADEIEAGVAIPFAAIPGFPQAAVAGHAGRLVIGSLEGVTVAALQGRFHLYEGHDAATVTLPVRVMIALGIRTLIVTNAAGGIERGLRTGDLMLIDDHINLTMRNPLVGAVVDGDTRFPDMSEAYDARLRSIARDVAERESIRLAGGVYAAVLGPSYETPAEIRMLETLGADAVGMSTVPEVIVARARGIPTLGISLITNAAAGVTGELLSHDDVVAAGTEARGSFTRLLRGVVAALPAMLDRDARNTDIG